MIHKPRKPMIGMLPAILGIAFNSFDQTAAAKQATPQTCPPGYSQVDNVCISDTSGDIVLPAKQR